MDTVRFGRALGMGARGAAKAALMAANAAASPKPPRSTPSAQIRPAQAVNRLRETNAGLLRGGRKFGETAWKPFVRAGKVLWLEFTGVFFGLFVLFGAVNAWKLRSSLHQTATNHTEHQHLLWSIAMTVLFGYFCMSSFVRAGRRGR